jgi:hypothetical protein
MALDGIWTLEVAGIHGWERVFTTFLEKGRSLSGSAESHTTGTYSVKGKKFKATVKVSQHGEIRTVFGEKHKQFTVLFSGKHEGDQIVGTISLKGAKSTDPKYPVRLLWQEVLPALP